MYTIPIMAIHGSASSGSMWKALQRLCGSKRKVLTPNLQGYGCVAPYIFPEPPSLNHRSDPLSALVDPQQGVHLVAHSFGSAVALDLVRKTPGHIKSLTLYEPVVPAIFKDAVNPQDVSLLGDLIGLSKIVSGTSGRVAMEAFINFWHFPGAWSAFSAETQVRLIHLAPVVFRDFQEAMNEPAGAYADLDFPVPVKILVGQNTQPHALRMARLLNQYLSQGSYEVMDAMGHMGPITHANQVSLAILDHVQKVEQITKAA